MALCSKSTVDDEPGWQEEFQLLRDSMEMLDPMHFKAFRLFGTSKTSILCMVLMVSAGVFPWIWAERGSRHGANGSEKGFGLAACGPQ